MPRTRSTMYQDQILDALGRIVNALWVKPGMKDLPTEDILHNALYVWRQKQLSLYAPVISFYEKYATHQARKMYDAGSAASTVKLRSDKDYADAKHYMRMLARSDDPIARELPPESEWPAFPWWIFHTRDAANFDPIRRQIEDKKRRLLPSRPQQVPMVPPSAPSVISVPGYDSPQQPVRAWIRSNCRFAQDN